MPLVLGVQPLKKLYILAIDHFYILNHSCGLNVRPNRSLSLTCEFVLFHLEEGSDLVTLRSIVAV